MVLGVLIWLYFIINAGGKLRVRRELGRKRGNRLGGG